MNTPCLAVAPQRQLTSPVNVKLKKVDNKTFCTKDFLHKCKKTCARSLLCRMSCIQKVGFACTKSHIRWKDFLHKVSIRVFHVQIKDQQQDIIKIAKLPGAHETA